MIIVIVTFLGLLLLAAVAVGVYFIKTQRELVRLDEMCKNAQSQIMVQLNSRFDVVLALARMAGKYAEYESKTIIDAVQARTPHAGGQQETPATLNQQNHLLADVMGRLNVVYERYPELKASELYVNTQRGQKQYEEQVRISRMIYNDTATKMNALVRQWPTSIVASLLHFGVKDYLTIDDEQKLGYPDL